MAAAKKKTDTADFFKKFAGKKSPTDEDASDYEGASASDEDASEDEASASDDAAVGGKANPLKNFAGKKAPPFKK